MLKVILKVGGIKMDHFMKKLNLSLHMLKVLFKRYMISYLVKQGPEVIKLVFMFDSTEHEFELLIKLKC